MAVLPRRTTVVWLVLVLVTMVSFWVGTGHVGTSARATTASVVVAGFVKAFLVGRHFMEVRDAPLTLRAIFGAWTGIFGTLCTVLVLC